MTVGTKEFDHGQYLSPFVDLLQPRALIRFGLYDDMKDQGHPGMLATDIFPLLKNPSYSTCNNMFIYLSLRPSRYAENHVDMFFVDRLWQIA